MPHPENIIPPKKGEIRNPKGRGKGVHNRSTILKKWIKAKQSIKNPITGIDEKLTQEDAVILALINQGRKGNINAIKEILDTLYGKNIENIDHTTNGESLNQNPDLSKLTDEELRVITELQRKSGISEA